jgi:tetratricopeptide (TPR) repeat protein
MKGHNLYRASLVALALCATGCETVRGGLGNIGNLLSNDAVAAGTMDALALATQGDAMRDRGDFRAAHDAYRTALQLEPRNPYIHVAIATAYVRQAGIAHENSKVQIPFRPFGDPGAARDATKYFNRALASCREALAINPNHAGAHFATAEAYAAVEDFRVAEEKFDDIEKRGLIPLRQEAAFYAWRGYVRLRLGRRERAKEDFQKASEMGRPFAFAEYSEFAANPPSPLEEWLSGIRPPRLPAVITDRPPSAPSKPQAIPVVSPAPPPTAPSGSVPSAAVPSLPTQESFLPGGSSASTAVPAPTMPDVESPGGAQPLAVGAAVYFLGGPVGLVAGLMGGGLLSSVIGLREPNQFIGALAFGGGLGYTLGTAATAAGTALMTGGDESTARHVATVTGVTAGVGSLLSAGVALFAFGDGGTPQVVPSIAALGVASVTQFATPIAAGIAANGE